VFTDANFIIKSLETSHLKYQKETVAYVKTIRKEWESF